MSDNLNVASQQLFTLPALLAFAFGCYLCLQSRKNILKTFMGLATLDLVTVFFSIGSATGVMLPLLYLAVARGLGYLTLGKLCQEASTKDPGELAGIGQSFPVTSMLFGLAVLSALGVSPFLTPDVKAFAAHAVVQNGGFLSMGILLASGLVSLFFSVQLVHTVCIVQGQHTFQKQPLVHGGGILALGLAAVLVYMGVFGHEVVATFAGKNLPQVPGFEVSWNLATLTLFAAAFALAVARQVGGRLIAYAAGLGALVLSGLFILGMADLAPLSRLFAIIVAGMGVLIWTYSFGYLADFGKNHESAYIETVYTFCFFILFGSLLGLATSTNAMAFFVFWELMTFSSYILIALARTEAAERAAKLYVLMSGGAAVFLLPALIYFGLGSGSFEFAGMAGGAGALTASGISLAALGCIIGFGVKAGLVPAHAWLPAAHPAAPSSISAPLSGVLTKAGIMGLVLVVFLVMQGAAGWNGGESFVPSWVLTVLMVLGAVTMLYGEAMALVQDDIKRLFAYSTIGQIGEITLVLSVGSALALTGGLFHVLNHAIMKDLLFLGSGALILRAGGQNLSDLKGLGKKMPFTGACMVIGLLSIMGLPPFAGFFSKYMMVMALADKSIFLAGLMLLASMAGCVYYMRIIRVLVFEEAPRYEIKEAPLSMRLPLGILAGLCIALGLVPSLGLSLVTPVVDSFSAAAGFATGLVSNSVLVPGLSFLPGVSWHVVTVLLLAAGVVPFFWRTSPKLLGMYTALVLFAAAFWIISMRGNLDSLSYAFAIIVPFIGGLNMYYAADYMKHSHAQWRFYSFFLFMCAGLVGVATSRDLFTFFVCWEIMSSWALYFVIVHEEDEAALREGFKYFFFNVLGAAFIFLGIAYLSAKASNLEFARLPQIFAELGRADTLMVASLMAIGFVMKAAQLPFRIDVQMHPSTAPTPVSGYISSVLLKSALFSVAKLVFAVAGVSTLGSLEFYGLQQTMMWIGGLTIVMAAGMAIFQSDLKLVLIYSTVSQLGYMLLGIALFTPLGMAGGLMHVANHVLFKNLLFLVAGALILQTGRHSLDEMGGVAVKMPKTFAVFAVGALCVIGVPPSNGFTSKWIIYHGLMEQGHVLLAILSLVGSVLTLAYFTKFMHKAFLGQPPVKNAWDNLTDPPKGMMLVMNLLALACIVTSIFPGLLLAPINAMLGEMSLGQLDVAASGIVSGRGAWNATVTSMLVLVVSVGSYLALARLTRVRRTGDIHTCGIDPETLHMQEAAGHVYSTPAILAKNTADMLSSHSNK